MPEINHDFWKELLTELKRAAGDEALHLLEKLAKVIIEAKKAQPGLVAADSNPDQPPPPHPPHG
jgi:hypothetical protein